MFFGEKNPKIIKRRLLKSIDREMRADARACFNESERMVELFLERWVGCWCLEQKQSIDFAIHRKTAKEKCTFNEKTHLEIIFIKTVAIENVVLR